MPKAKLEFDLNDSYERSAHKRAVSATDAYIALHKIANNLFRPARKHGYSEEGLQNLSQETIDAIGLLEEKFYNILEEQGVDLEDLE